MTKQDLQKELQEKVKEGIKPSDIKKLQRSKSLDNIPTTSLPITPLQKSKSQLEIPLTNQPSKDQQISQLKQTLTFTQTTAQNYLQNLQLAQAKITGQEEKEKQDQQKISQLEEQILQLRLDKIKEFGDYLEKKAELTQELEENITAGTQEIERLENKLLTTNKKKLELQQKLGTSESKQAQLELKLLNNSTPAPTASLIDDYWPLIWLTLTSWLSLWLLSKNTPHHNH